MDDSDGDHDVAVAAVGLGAWQVVEGGGGGSGDAFALILEVCRFDAEAGQEVLQSWLGSGGEVSLGVKGRVVFAIQAGKSISVEVNGHAYGLVAAATCVRASLIDTRSPGGVRGGCEMAQNDDVTLVVWDDGSIESVSNVVACRLRVVDKMLVGDATMVTTAMALSSAAPSPLRLGDRVAVGVDSCGQLVFAGDSWRYLFEARVSGVGITRGGAHWCRCCPNSPNLNLPHAAHRITPPSPRDTFAGLLVFVFALERRCCGGGGEYIEFGLRRCGPTRGRSAACRARATTRYGRSGGRTTPVRTSSFARSRSRVDQ